MRAGPDIGELVRGSGEKVLIVDDEVDILETFEILLTEGLGYRAASANNAEAAIDKYKTWRPDAVLLDRNMPEMGGLKCAQRIIEYDPGARVVLVSGHDEEGPSGIDSKTKALIKGYLTKPITMEELGRMLGRLFVDARSRV
jgi:CheY-like chemotaxis protein